MSTYLKLESQMPTYMGYELRYRSFFFSNALQDPLYACQQSLPKVLGRIWQWERPVIMRHTWHNFSFYLQTCLLHFCLK